MKKNILFVIIISIFLLCACKNGNTSAVNIEIDASDILLNYQMLDESLRSEKYVPADGIIVKDAEVEIPEGGTVIDALKAICADKNIQFDVSDGYVKGINYIYEKSCGPMSGWIYEINNESVMGDYTLVEGDTITWKYICDFSKFYE